MTVEIEYSSLSPVASSQLANYAMKFEDVSMDGDDDERRDGLFSFFKGVGEVATAVPHRTADGRGRDLKRTADRLTYAQFQID